MSINIECEERVMLTYEQYMQILTDTIRNNSNPVFIMQRNDYIDTSDLSLKNNHKVLRIRFISPLEIELTLKIKGKDGDEEHNQNISIETMNMFYEHDIFPEGEIKNILLSLDRSLSEYKLKTSLCTRRYEEHIDDYLLVIDKNDYSNIIDYNLEIEAPNKQRAKEVIDMYCKKYNLTYDKKYRSKSRRALDSIK